jgi:hypothetical protein
METYYRTHNCTLRKMHLILRSIERMLQVQCSMARKFSLWRLRRYSVKHYEVRPTLMLCSVMIFSAILRYTKKKITCYLARARVA